MMPIVMRRAGNAAADFDDGASEFFGGCVRPLRYGIAFGAFSVESRN